MLLLLAFPDIRARVAEGQVESHHLVKSYSKLTLSLDLWSDQTSTLPEPFTVRIRKNILQVSPRVKKISVTVTLLNTFQTVKLHYTIQTPLQSSTQIQPLQFQQKE